MQLLIAASLQLSQGVIENDAIPLDTLLSWLGSLRFCRALSHCECVTIKPFNMVSQALMSSKLCAARQATASSISGRPLLSRPQQQRSIARRGAPVAAETKEAEKKGEKKDEKKPFQPPALDPNTPSPIFGGSTGGLLRKAQVGRASADDPMFIVTGGGIIATL